MPERSDDRPICGSVGRPVGMEDGYEIARCAHCEHAYVVDLPSAHTVEAANAVLRMTGLGDQMYFEGIA